MPFTELHYMSCQAKLVIICERWGVGGGVGGGEDMLTFFSFQITCYDSWCGVSQVKKSVYI